MNEDDFKLALEKLVVANTFSVAFSSDANVLVPETQEISIKEMLPSPVKMEHTLEDTIAGNIGNSNAKHDNLSVEVIIKELNSF